MKKFWSQWKIIAEKIGNFQINAVFSFLYFAIVTPIGMIVNSFQDYFGLKKFPEWYKVSDNSSGLKKLRNQF